jgi:IPT/TIG domain
MRCRLRNTCVKMKLFLIHDSILKLTVPLVLMFAIIGLKQTVLSQASQIKEITPTAARVGEQVTITGNGFSALNVQITVGDKPAQILSANGHEATLIVPAGVAPRPAKVIASNPGGQSGSIDFLMLESYCQVIGLCGGGDVGLESDREAESVISELPRWTLSACFVGVRWGHFFTNRLHVPARF